MHGIKRNSYRKAQKLLEVFPAIVILGSRQCGKTTLAKQLGSNWNYFDLANFK
jgi:predicted AAA+ superfamily ATPase